MTNRPIVFRCWGIGSAADAKTRGKRDKVRKNTKKYSKFAQTIRDARLKLRSPQKDVAAKLGVSQASYSAGENGDNRPKIDKLSALAEGLEIAVDKLERALRDDEREETSDAAPSVDIKFRSPLIQRNDSADFASESLTYTRGLFGDKFNITLVSPHSLPIVNSDKIQDEWVLNIEKGCKYRIIWFVDFQLLNISRHLDHQNRLYVSLRRAFEQVSKKVANLDSDGGVEHAFVWSGLLRQREIPTHQAKVLATFISSLSLLEHTKVYISTNADQELNNHLNSNAGDDSRTNTVYKITSHHAASASKAQQLNDTVTGNAKELAARFWSNGDALVIYSPIEDVTNVNYDPLDTPVGYIVPRSGFRSFNDFAAAIDEAKSPSLPRVLDLSHAQEIDEITEYFISVAKSGGIVGRPVQPEPSDIRQAKTMEPVAG